MNLAKISANGQVTVPMEIRKKLNLKEGDKILFFERSDGENEKRRQKEIKKNVSPILTTA